MRGIYGKFSVALRSPLVVGEAEAGSKLLARTAVTTDREIFMALLRSM